MRVFGIEPTGNFQEYLATPFQTAHAEVVLEDWLEENPEGVLEDGKLLIIGRQVSTNLGSTIDLLAVDRVGDVVVIELKRDRTPRDTLAQALEYASFAEGLDTAQLENILRSYMADASLAIAEYHREYFELASDEAVAFNKDQRIVIVGQRITAEIRQTALFLRSKGVRVTCVEFSFFQTNGGTKLLSQEIVVGSEVPRALTVASRSLPIITRDAFLQSLDAHGRLFFEKMLGFAHAQAMPVHWGTKGFSLNVDLNETHVAIFYCYPPASVYRQSIYTAVMGAGGMSSKTAVPDEEIQNLLKQGEATGLFQPAGHELKCLINRSFTDDEINRILCWCKQVAATVTKYGLRE